MVKVKSPKHNIIEKTAGDMAATFWEVGRSSGMKSKYKTARLYAKANIEKFVPMAVGILLDMLNSPDYNEHIKQTIYEAVIERIHDPDTALMMEGVLPSIDISKILDCKPDAPVIINSRKFNPAIHGKVALDFMILMLQD